MDIRETAAILAMIAAVDSRRSFGEIDVSAWHAVIGDFTFDDAREAVISHYRESPHSITPSDINTRVGAWRRKRIGNRIAPVPPVDANDIAGYQRWIGAWFTAVADGATDAEAQRRADAEIGIARQAIQHETSPRSVDYGAVGKSVPNE